MARGGFRNYKAGVDKKFPGRPDLAEKFVKTEMQAKARRSKNAKAVKKMTKILEQAMAKGLTVRKFEAWAQEELRKNSGRTQEELRKK
jgi:hypothetical protein